MNYSSIFILERHLGFVICIILSAFEWIWKILLGSQDSTQPRKIVFVKFVEQGAFVLHMATIKRATIKYGCENVYVCTFSSNAALMDVLNVVSPQNIIYIQDKSVYRFPVSFLCALLQIRKFRIDTAIDLEFYSRATAIFCYLIGAKKRAGYHRYYGEQNYRGNLFTHRLNYSHYVHVADSGSTLLQSVELTSPNMLPALNVDLTLARQSSTPQFMPKKADSERLGRLLDKSVIGNNPIIVINLSLNDVLPLRKWPETNYRDFITLFRREFPEFTFVFTGRSDEIKLTAKFINDAQIYNAVNLCGRTELRDLLTLYTKSKLLITSDSGPAHLATLTHIPTIVLFGPETPRLYAPLSDRAKVLYLGLACSPCFNVYNNRRSPCKNNMCMKSITVEQVMSAAIEILKA